MIETKAMVRALMEKCSESRSYIFDYAIVRWLEPMETCSPLDCPPNSRVHRLETASVIHQTSWLCAPTTSQEPVFGCNELQSFDGDGGPSLARRPFGVINCMLTAAQVTHHRVVAECQPLPCHNFFMESVRPSVHCTEGWLHTAVAAPVPDSFWYFNIDTPQSQRHSQATEAEAAVTAEALALALPRPPSSFQLYLPDPDMVDRLSKAQTDGKGEELLPLQPPQVYVENMEPTHSHPEVSAKSSPKPSHKPALSAKSSPRPSSAKSSPRPSPGDKKKRVVIADPPVSQEILEEEDLDQPPMSLRQRLGSAGRMAMSGLYSVQRPRNAAPAPMPRTRSRSASRRRRENEKMDR